MNHAYLYFLSLIAARTAIVVVVLIIGLRLIGKRQIGNAHLFDLAMIMAVANAVQNAMTHGAGDLSAGVICAGTLILLGRVASAVFVHLPRLEERVVGQPTVLVSNGLVMDERMRREHVTRTQLDAAVRSHGITDVRDVLMAVLEVDGDISIVPRGAPHRTIRRRPRGGSADTGA